MRIPTRNLAPGVLAVALGVSGALGAACAAPRASVEKQADGAARLRCRMSLPDCLTEVERLCQGRHYLVLRAVDEHDPRGGPELNLDVRTSEALVRCGPATGWPKGFDPMALHPPSAPLVAPSERACAPGASTACTGPGGCAGGQVCSSDGSAYGPCDCGPVSGGSS
jgi:hypothetical protein